RDKLVTGVQTCALPISWLLTGSLAASAAGSLRRERESGLLELILISPLGEWQIIRGRLRALWSQFAPAAALYLAVSLWMMAVHQIGRASCRERVWRAVV